jgi:hypothetical protein
MATYIIPNNEPLSLELELEFDEFMRQILSTPELLVDVRTSVPGRRKRPYPCKCKLCELPNCKGATKEKIFCNDNSSIIICDGECSICLDLMTDQINTNQISTLACGHFFHEKCITSWKIQSETCPMCLAEIH